MFSKPRFFKTKSQVSNLRTFSTKVSFIDPPQVKLQKLQAQTKQTLVNQYNNTILHSTIQQGTIFTKPTEVMHYFGEEVTTVLSKISNDEAKLPLDYVKPSLLLHPDKEITTTTLKSAMCKNEYKPMRTMINEDEVLHAYHRKDNPSLNANLKLGCKIHNQILANVEVSSTHPEINELTHAERVAIRKRVDSMRKKCDVVERELYGIYSNQIILSYKIIETTATIATEEKAMNCFEFSAAGVIQSIKEDSNRMVRFCQMVNGDHGFFMIGNNDIDGVFVDIWANGVYPSAERNKRLANCRWLIDDVKNPESAYATAITSYNPRCHFIKVVFSNQNYKEYLALTKHYTNDAAFFAKPELKEAGAAIDVNDTPNKKYS